MMVGRKTFLSWWIGGVVAFIIVIGFSLPLIITAVPGGIGDHQAAGDAATVNAIHAAWAAAGLMDNARTAIAADLVFIGIYGIGSLMSGLYFRSVASGMAKQLGTLILICAAVFLLTDYTETIAQLLQVHANEGSDQLANLAATVRPIKMVTWVITFVGTLALLGVERRQRAKA